MLNHVEENGVIPHSFHLALGILCLIAFFTLVFVQPGLTLNQTDIEDAADMVLTNAENQAQLINGINDRDLVTLFIIVILVIMVVAAWWKFSALILPIAILILVLFVLNWRGYF